SAAEGACRVADDRERGDRDHCPLAPLAGGQSGGGEGAAGGTDREGPHPPGEAPADEAEPSGEGEAGRLEEGAERGEGRPREGETGLVKSSLRARRGNPDVRRWIASSLRFSQ